MDQSCTPLRPTSDTLSLYSIPLLLVPVSLMFLQLFIRLNARAAIAVSFDMFGFVRRKAKDRRVRTGTGILSAGLFIPDFLSANNTTSGFGLDPGGFTFSVPSSPSADFTGAVHQKSSPSASALPLRSAPAKMTSISDIIFSNAAFDTLLESRNAGDQ